MSQGTDALSTPAAVISIRWVAWVFPAADFVHDPIVLIEHDFPAPAFMPPGETVPNIILPGQIFAALLAEIKGLDPDKPRSLKIVTQTV